ncbi:hypothetical protein PWT90_02235 [Aphanocladium album]|nr:hypothetical protein PWT90_02235 [Aphanocladium album]
MPLFGGNYRAHRSHDNFSSSSPTFSGSSSPFSDSQSRSTPPTSCSSDELNFNHCHDSQEVNRLKRDLQDVSQDNRTLKRRCGDLDKALRVAKQKNSAPIDCQNCRGGEKETAYHHRVAVKAAERANKAEEELDSAMALFAQQTDRQNARGRELHEQIDTLRHQLTEQIDEQLEAGRASARKLAALAATKNDHITALGAELSRVKREHEATLAQRSEQDRDRRQCIQWLSERLVKECPKGVYGHKLGAAATFEQLKNKVNYLAGKLRSDSDRRNAMRALIERSECLEMEQRCVQRQLAELEAEAAEEFAFE